jgi:hypothetical protein
VNVGRPQTVTRPLLQPASQTSPELLGSELPESLGPERPPVALHPNVAVRAAVNIKVPGRFIGVGLRGKKQRPPYHSGTWSETWAKVSPRGAVMLRRMSSSCQTTASLMALTGLAPHPCLYEQRDQRHCSLMMPTHEPMTACGRLSTWPACCPQSTIARNWGHSGQMRSNGGRGTIVGPAVLLSCCGVVRACDCGKPSPTVDAESDRVAHERRAN